jgi:hypothetical protein
MDDYAYYLIKNPLYGTTNQDCPPNPECIIVRMKLNVSDDEKRRTEKRFGVDCKYRKGFKMIKSDGRHLILVCANAPKGDDKEAPPLN